MKYFFPVLMGATILFGVGLTFTPIIMELVWPASQTSYQRAQADDARRAIADWFGVPLNEVQAAQSIRQHAVQGTTTWFYFAMPRKGVEQFIIQHRLQQRPLSDTVLQQQWLANKPPVDWWQPARLKRETYFSGNDGRNNVTLIYNATEQQGFMQIQTQPTPRNDF